MKKFLAILIVLALFSTFVMCQPTEVEEVESFNLELTEGYKSILVEWDRSTVEADIADLADDGTARATAGSAPLVKYDLFYAEGDSIEAKDKHRIEEIYPGYILIKDDLNADGDVTEIVNDQAYSIIVRAYLDMDADGDYKGEDDKVFESKPATATPVPNPKAREVRAYKADTAGKVILQWEPPVADIDLSGGTSKAAATAYDIEYYLQYAQANTLSETTPTEVNVEKNFKITLPDDYTGTLELDKGKEYSFAIYAKLNIPEEETEWSGISNVVTITPPADGDEQTYEETLAFEEDFEDGLSAEWGSDKKLDSGTLVIAENEGNGGDAATPDPDVTDGKWIGNQLVLKDVSEGDKIVFDYNIPSNAGETKFGIWDMDVSTSPAWATTGSTTAYETYEHYLSTDSEVIWIGVVEWKDSSDEVYIDNVKVMPTEGSSISLETGDAANTKSLFGRATR